MHTFRSRAIYVLGLLLVGLVVMFALPSGRSVAASTFTVNTPADVVDETPGDGKCETHAGNNVCTLRAAIQEANALPGTDTINLAGIKYTLARPGTDDTALNGDLDITESVNIVGAGQGSTIIDGNGSGNNDRVFQTFGVVSMSGLTITGGKSSNDGGGLINYGILTLDHVAISGNTVSGTNDRGGGISNSGTLTVTNSTVSGNTTGNHYAYGGGVFNQGPMTITDSTISGNSTFAGTSSPGHGGGIYLGGSAAATIRNSTISGNTGADGGGIYAGGTTVAIINSTVDGNSSTAAGGGVYNASGTLGLYSDTITSNVANSDHTGGGVGGGVLNDTGTTSFVNTIIAYNGHKQSTSNPFPFFYSDDCSGTITSVSNNIVQTPNPDGNLGQCTINGASAQVDPQLGPLQNNGGSTQTRAISNGSPAIDAGNAGGCTDNFGAILTTDQRGDPRAVDGDSNGSAICDIGAFEYQGAATPTPTPSPTPSETATPSPTSTSTPTPTPTSTGGTSGTPTRTSTPTPTASHTPTPTSSNPAQLIEGDLDCDHTVNAKDALSELDFLAGLNPGQHQPCPAVDSLSPKFGDLNCNNSIDGGDITKLLRHLGGLPVSDNPPCPQIGAARLP